MSFFGFDTGMPGDPRAKQGQQHPQHGQQSQFASRADQDTFGSFDRAGEEDLAVYNWGEGGLLETGDDFNDETFGDTGDFGECLLGGSLLTAGHVANSRRRLPVRGRDRAGALQAQGCVDDVALRAQGAGRPVRCD